MSLPSGPRAIATSTVTFSRPMIRSIHSPLNTPGSPQSNPSSARNRTVSSMSSTTRPTWTKLVTPGRWLSIEVTRLARDCGLPKSGGYRRRRRALEHAERGGTRTPPLLLDATAAAVDGGRVDLLGQAEGLLGRRPAADAGDTLRALEAERLVQPERVVARVGDNHEALRPVALDRAPRRLHDQPGADPAPPVALGCVDDLEASAPGRDDDPAAADDPRVQEGDIPGAATRAEERTLV